MNENTRNLDLNTVINDMNINLEEIAPNYKKGVLSKTDKERIIEKIALEVGIPLSDALAGTILLFLKGAASSGTPSTLSIDLRGGKTIAKKNIQASYMAVTGNTFIRRLAEALAIEIGEFAFKYGLSGELSTRINTILKSESGERLTPEESAWCSSFSQEIPDLAQRSSERLVKLLAEDYKKRFENKKRTKKEITYPANKKGGKKR